MKDMSNGSETHHASNSFKRQSCHYIETSQLICRANQLAGFYVLATLAFNELITTIQTF